jgi:ankyrin repeat protein
VVDVLLKGGADVNARDDFNYTPLMLATFPLVGFAQVAEILLKREDIEVDATNDYSQSALLLAASVDSERFEMVRLLLKCKKVNINRQDR